MRLREVESNDSTRIIQLSQNASLVPLDANPMPSLHPSGLLFLCVRAAAGRADSLFRVTGRPDSPGIAQDMPNCFSSPLPQGEGHIFHICPSFFGSISLFCLKTLSSDATESARRLSRGPVTTPPHPPTLSCPGYSEFCILPFGWFLLLLCSYFSFLHLFPLGCTLL